MLLSSELIYLKGMGTETIIFRLSACADSRINFQAQQRVMDMQAAYGSDIKKIREEIEYRKLVVERRLSRP